MYIKTAQGWKYIETKHVKGPADEAYRGPLPSLACLSFIRELEHAHAENVRTGVAFR